MRALFFAIVFIGFSASCSESKKIDFNIDSLPQEWTKLTEVGDNLVIYNSCEAQNFHLTFSRKNESTELQLQSYHDDFDFLVLKSIISKDTIYIKVKPKDSKEIQDFRFAWTDKQKGIGKWILKSSNRFGGFEAIFVLEENKSNFKIVDQPCRECWGDLCD